MFPVISFAFLGQNLQSSIRLKMVFWPLKRLRLKAPVSTENSLCLVLFLCFQCPAQSLALSRYFIMTVSER